MERAGEGAGERVRGVVGDGRWSGGGCGGSSVAVELAGEGAGGIEMEGIDFEMEGDRDRDGGGIEIEMEGDRDQVSMKYTLMAHQGTVRH